MSSKFLVGIVTDDVNEIKKVMELISKHLDEMKQNQQRLPDNVGGEGSPVFVPATDKQRVLMSKMKIVWDNSTSKDEASRLITEKLEHKKSGGGEGNIGEKNPL